MADKNQNNGYSDLTHEYWIIYDEPGACGQNDTWRCMVIPYDLFYIRSKNKEEND